MNADLAALIERVRAAGDMAAALELAALIEATLVRAPRRRGGEPRWRAEARAKRDDALRDLAQLIGADLSLEQRATELSRRIGRYRAVPTDADGSAMRQVLHRIAKTGVPVPRLRQLKRILREKASDMQKDVWMSENQSDGFCVDHLEEDR